jgi:hypothetical protein
MIRSVGMVELDLHNPLSASGLAISAAGHLFSARALWQK